MVVIKIVHNARSRGRETKFNGKLWIYGKLFKLKWKIKCRLRQLHNHKRCVWNAKRISSVQEVLRGGNISSASFSNENGIN